MKALNGWVRNVTATTTLPLHRVLLTMFLATLALGMTGRANAANPDPSMAAKVDAATFEVVIPKADNDPLTRSEEHTSELQSPA